MAAGSGFLTPNVRLIFLLAQTLPPSLSWEKSHKGCQVGSMGQSMPCQLAVLSPDPLWLSLKEVLELPIGGFRKELHMPVDDEQR